MCKDDDCCAFFHKKCLKQSKAKKCPLCESKFDILKKGSREIYHNEEHMKEDKMRANLSFATQVVKLLLAKEKRMVNNNGNNNNNVDKSHRILLLDGKHGHSSHCLRLMCNANNLKYPVKIYVPNVNESDAQDLKMLFHHKEDCPRYTERYLGQCKKCPSLDCAKPLVDYVFNQKIGTFLSNIRHYEVKFDAIWLDWCGTFEGGKTIIKKQGGRFFPREDVRKSLHYGLTEKAVIGYTVCTRDASKSHEDLINNHPEMANFFGFKVKECNMRSYPQMLVVFDYLEMKNNNL